MLYTQLLSDLVYHKRYRLSTICARSGTRCYCRLW